MERLSPPVSPAGDTAQHPVVERETPLGRVRGYSRRGVQAFLGLRYAQPAQRFRPPQPAQPWAGVYDATRYRARCPQPRVADPTGMPGATRGGFDEDCLFLNVYAPEGDGPRPVLVWIHGGGFVGGSANQFDGTALAARADAVVVTVNYRLGLLGWLDLSELGPDYRDSADVWLADQVMALTWVRDTIASFGGDPACVTIIGESAGGGAVVALCGLPGARGLFHRAVACSPPNFTSDPRPDLLGRVAKARRCSREQARTWALEAPADELVALTVRTKLSMPMTTSGPLLAAPATDEIAARGSAAPPLIAGFASHEGDFFLTGLDASSWLFRGPLGNLILRVMARAARAQSAGSEAEAPAYDRRLRRHHRPNGRRYADLLMTEIFRRGSTSPVLATTRAGSHGYLYEMDVPCRLGDRAMRSTHVVDVPLTFNVFADPGAWEGFTFVDTPEAPELAERWVDVLARFARTGDPSGPLGEWPAYDDERRLSLLVTPEGGEVCEDRDGAHRKAVWAEDAASAAV